MCASDWRGKLSISVGTNKLGRIWLHLMSGLKYRQRQSPTDAKAEGLRPEGGIGRFDVRDAARLGCVNFQMRRVAKRGTNENKQKKQKKFPNPSEYQREISESMLWIY